MPIRLVEDKKKESDRLTASDIKKAKKRLKESKPGKRGNPSVVETYEDARENKMINRNVPTMKHGGEAVVRGMGCAIKGGKFEGVF